MEYGNQGIPTQYCNPQYQEEQFFRNQGRLDYEYAKGRLDLEKQQASLSQRLEFEEKSRQIRVAYHTYQQMLGSTVYRDSDGRLIYAISDSEGKDIRSRPLLNVRNYKPVLYVSYFPKTCAVLEVSWGDTNQNSVSFLYDNDGLSPDVFLKKLKAHGVLMLVSGRMEKEAAAALLAYSIDSAEEVELSFTYGWNKGKDGRWHFAYNQELTMREVLQDV
ncbi:hypothetical protein D7V86_09065 [bacterium D16-51]|nr:hypothetical protein D7V96_09080 [bacterium D16-59]RKI60510.1 hypothetical protein D7V86_09065 [bacterium D16-51]